MTQFTTDITKGLRHYGFDNRSKKPIIILGYNKTTDTVAVFKKDNLPLDLRNEVMSIANSPNAQNEDHLMTVLCTIASSKDPTKSVFDFIAGSFGYSVLDIRLPRTDIVFENPHQEAFFGGWGEPINPKNTRNRSGFREGAQTPQNNLAPSEFTPNGQPQVPVDALLSAIGDLKNMIGTLSARVEAVETKDTPKTLLTETPATATPKQRSGRRKKEQAA